jgi:hypothetical protein
MGTYNQTVGVKLSMDDAIFILTPSDVPLQQKLGSEPVDQKKIEWLEEDLTPQEVTVNATSALGSSTIVLVADDGSKVRVDDVLMKKDGTVQALVTAIATDTLTVTRPFAGSTDEALAANDILHIIGQYRVEGSDPLAGRFVDRTTAYNMTQIDQEKVEVTRTEKKRAQYGVSDPYDHEVQKKFKELAIRYERRLINGRRVESGDLKQRAMGGFFYYVTTNSRSNTKANIETALNDILQDCYTQGGAPTWLVVSPAIARVISALNASRITYPDSGAGSKRGQVVERFLSDFGEVGITIDRHLPKTKALVVQPDYFKVSNFDDYFHELLAKTGDAEKGEIVAEKSCKVKNQKAHGVLTITDA